jgi:hypothetical protein
MPTMALVHFVRRLLGAPLTVDSAEVWFMMQIAMAFGLQPLPGKFVAHKKRH